MRELVLARRYAGALLKLSKDAKAVDSVRTSLSDLAMLVAGSRPLFRAITDEKIPLEKKFNIVKKIGELISMNELAVRFVELLIQKGRIGHVSTIANVFSSLADETLGIKRGEISVVDRQVGEAIKPSLEAGLSKKLNKKVEINIKEDPSVLGGALLKVENVIYDASIRRSVQELKERLCQ